MEKAAVYLRISKEDLDREGDSHSKSIENQRIIVTDYALKHGWSIQQYYVDDDYSGLYYERPAFSQMLKDARSGQFGVILAKSQSRLSRNMEHTEYLLHSLFPMLGIRFIGVVDGVDTAQKYGKKARQINALVNEWYSEDLSESIRAVYRQKMEKGEYLGAYAPYGYRKSQKDSHVLEIDRNVSYWVQCIFEWYVQGFGVEAIKARLEKERVATPLSYRQDRNPPDYQWSASTIKKILRNETYTGMVVQGKSRRRSFKDKSIQYIDKKSWIIVQGTHEPIISRELFERAAKRRRECNTHIEM